MNRLLSLLLAVVAPVLVCAALLAPAASAANTCTVPYCPPATVTTGPAIDVKDDSATLTGIVNSNGSDTTCHFELGSTSGVYTVNSPDITILGNTTADQGVTADVSGLDKSNVYFFRLVCSNLGGITNGKERAFVAGEDDDTTTGSNTPSNTPTNTPTNTQSTNTQPTTTNGTQTGDTSNSQPSISTPSTVPAIVIIERDALNAETITMADLVKLLTGQRLAALFAGIGFTSTYTAPSAGVFQNDLFAVGTPGHAYTAKAHKFALVARGTHTFAAAGTASVKAKPTHNRRLLKKGRLVRLLIRTTFTPKDGKPVVVRRTKTVRVKR